MPPAKGKSIGEAIKFTPEQLKIIYRLSLIGTPVEDIAKVLECSRDTIDRHPDSRAEVERGRREGDGAIRQTAFKMAVSGKSPGMTAFLCKVRLHWREKQELEVTGKGGGPIEQNIFAGLSEESIRDLANIIARSVKPAIEVEPIPLGETERSEGGHPSF